jgi:DNA-binding CsgD family transcriptional regulator
MRRTILSDYSELLLAIYRHAQELSVDEFQDGALTVLKKYLPFDSSMWGTATMTRDGIDIHSLHLHETTQAMIDAYEHVKHLDAAARRVTEKPTATIAFHTATDFEGEALQSYRAFLHEFRHENFFITSDINPYSHFVHWVSLYRFDPGMVCAPEETELLSCIAPHLMQALAINRLVHLHQVTGDAARDSWSVAIADNRGVLYHADARFRELVGTEWPGPPGESEVRLPPGLLDALGVDNQVGGARVIVRQSVERGLLYLKARPRAPVDSLTARELLVARLLVSGLTQKQVAQKLERSHETIRSQVKAIFDKLQINNVAQLGTVLVLRD